MIVPINLSRATSSIGSSPRRVEAGQSEPHKSFNLDSTNQVPFHCVKLQNKRRLAPLAKENLFLFQSNPDSSASPTLREQKRSKPSHVILPKIKSAFTPSLAGRENFAETVNNAISKIKAAQ